MDEIEQKKKLQYKVEEASNVYGEEMRMANKEFDDLRNLRTKLKPRKQIIIESQTEVVTPREHLDLYEIYRII